ALDAARPEPLHCAPPAFYVTRRHVSRCQPRWGMKRTVKTPSRPATYGTATRLARIVYGLMGRPHGWSFEAIQEELAISERTLLRYVAACRRELVDGEGRPLLEAVRRGERRVLRLAEGARAPDSTSYQALSLYLAL